MKLLFALGIFEILFLLLVVLAIILAIAALLGILSSRFEQNDKLVWVIVVIFIPIIGPILYLTMGRKNRIID